MALPALDATFASSADLPRKQMLAKWLVEELGSGSIADYYSLPEHCLWAKIAVAAGAPKTEADYISLKKQYILADIYKAVSGGREEVTFDMDMKTALGHIAAAYRGNIDTASSLATYIDWPWRYQIASIIDHLIGNYNAVIVSGAGTETANGTYILSGKENGKNKYINGINYISWSGSYWLIYDDITYGDWVYVTSENTDLPWRATFITTNGDEPAPTLTPTNV